MSTARDRDKSELILLIGDFMAARRQQNDSAIAQATAALHEFSQNTAFPNLQTKASATIAAATVADINEGLRRMADIAEQLSPLRQTFQAAAEIAEDGQTSLFFPRVASTLVQVQELLSSMLETAKTFEADVSAIREGFDIDKLKVLIEQIRQTGSDLGEKIDALSA